MHQCMYPSHIMKYSWRPSASVAPLTRRPSVAGHHCMDMGCCLRVGDGGLGLAAEGSYAIGGQERQRLLLGRLMS